MAVQSGQSPFISGYFSGPLVIGRGTFDPTFSGAGGVPVTHFNVGDPANPSYQAAFSMRGSITIAGLDGTTNGWLYNNTSSTTGNSPNIVQAYSTLTFGTNDDSGTFAGTVGRAPNSNVYNSNLNLIKNGAGTQRFSGNMYNSGITNVSAGALIINGTQTAVISSGISSYAARATGTGGQYNVSGILGGTGTIIPFDTAGTTTAMIDVLAGGSIAPGDGGIGTLTLDGSNSVSSLLKFESGASLTFDLGAALSSDQIAIANSQTNDVTFTGNTINFNALSPLAGGSYTLFTAASLSAYAGLSNDATGTITSGLSIAPTFMAAHPGSTLQLANNDILLNIASGPASLTWNGNGTTWEITSSNWNNSTGAAAFSNGTSGAGDKVTFNDSNNGQYSVTVIGTVTPSSTVFNNSSGNYTISGSNSSSGIGGSGGLTKLGTGTVTLSSSNTYTGGTSVNAGKLVLASATAFPTGTALNVSSGATVQIANHSGSSSYVPTLSVLSNSGTIDLTNNAMVIQGANASIGTLFSQVARGYANGAWNGTNSSSGVIVSSAAAVDSSHLTAVGIATGLTSFQGAGGAVSVSSSDVVLKYTYYGDSNLDGKVDGTDYSRIDNGFLTSATGWSNGDFNYDGIVNGSDYTLIDNAYNRQGVSLLASVASPLANPTSDLSGSNTTAVPEPLACLAFAIGAVLQLGRRGRRATPATV
jgi:autotransporter-associated beta strand protein